jgi:hypothetical protein
MPGRLDMIRGQFRSTNDLVRLNIRSTAVERRMVVVAAEFSRRDEPDAMTVIDAGIERLTPASLVAQLLAL